MNGLFPITTETIFFLITIIGVTFSVYRSYREPDIAATQEIALMQKDIERNSSNVDKLLMNHVPHLQAKIDDVHEDLSLLKISVEKLATIIEERIPRGK